MRLAVLLITISSTLAAAALAGSNRDAEILAQAQRYQLEYRQGKPAVAKPLVSLLEGAVAQSPGNAELWAALGHGYMSLQGTVYTSPPDIPALIDTAEHARAAYARSLALNPDRPLVRSSHGMSKFVLSQLRGDAAGMNAGIDEMNAAVRDAPKTTTVRLTRGFTIIHLPPAMRDTKAVIEDLNHILDAAPGGRAEDVLHVMLGDVFAETGDLPAARREYAAVSGASAFAAAQVKTRLVELAGGSVSPASITAVRMGTGTNCAMCHAPGTDSR